MFCPSGAAPSEMLQRHREVLALLDSQTLREKREAQDKGTNEENLSTIQYKHVEDIQYVEIERRQELARESIQRITQTLTQVMKGKELGWQQQSIRWISLARRKIAVKLKEDEDAKARKKKRTGGR